MYAWASREYMLDCMTWEEILMYYENGIGVEETKAKVWISTYARALNHEAKTETIPPVENTEPDKAGFKAVLQQMRG